MIAQKKMTPVHTYIASPKRVCAGCFQASLAHVHYVEPYDYANLFWLLENEVQTQFIL